LLYQLYVLSLLHQTKRKMTHTDLYNELKKAGFEGHVTESNTDFGQSFYFIVDNVKVRVSDHSVENSTRLFNERHFHQEDYLQAVEYMEKVLFPERFEIIYTGMTIGTTKIRQYIRK